MLSRAEVLKAKPPLRTPSTFVAPCHMQASGDVAAEAAEARQQQRGGTVPLVVVLPEAAGERAAALAGGVDGALLPLGDAALREVGVEAGVAQLARAALSPPRGPEALLCI